MRGRTLGNSTNALYRQLCARHREQWVSQSAEYLSVLGKFMAHATDPGRLAAQIPQMIPVPCTGWLLSVYAKDVLTRLPELKARITSINGSILKWIQQKGKRTQIHNFSITRDAGFSQYLFNSYFRSLRSSLARQLEQQHGRPTWATSLDRSSCVSLRQQRVTVCFPCAPD